MAAYEVLLLNTAIPQIQAAQAGDTYVVPRDIAFSTVAGFAAGSSSAPAIMATGDTNTGLFFPAADTVAITTGGSERTRIDSSGTLILRQSSNAANTSVSFNTTVQNALTLDSGGRLLVGGASAISSEKIQTLNTSSGAVTNAIRMINGGTAVGTGTQILFSAYANGGNFEDYAVIQGVATGATAGSLVFRTNNAGAFPAAMTLDASGNLLVGTTSQTDKVTIDGGGVFLVWADDRKFWMGFSNTYRLGMRLNAASRTTTLFATGDTGDGGTITFNTRAAAGSGATDYGTERARIDASGNLGLGVTPQTDWGASFKVFEISGNGIAGTGSQLQISQNAYTTGSGVWKYLSASSQLATRYEQNAGVHSWHIAPAGTSPNTASFTQAMTLDASGNLLLGTTSSIYTQSNRTVIEFNGTSDALLSWKRNGGNVFYVHNNSSAVDLWNTANTPMIFATNNTECARITSGGLVQVSSGGSVQIGGTAARATTAGTNRLDIFNGTAPVGTLSNGISIYSSSGEAYVMDAAGNATLFSPHDAETNEWIFKSKHTPTGKVLKIDVEKLLRFINDHFGLDAVHEFIEE